VGGTYVHVQSAVVGQLVWKRR